MKTRPWYRLFAVLLSAAFFLQTAPVAAQDTAATAAVSEQVPAPMTDADTLTVSPDQTDTAPAATDAIPAAIVEEDTAKRESQIKYYRLDDGSHMAAIYSEPVHYQQNGQWLDIDNSLVEQTLAGDLKGPGARALTASEKQALTLGKGKTPAAAVPVTPYLVNRSNSFQVQLPNNLAPSAPVRIAQDGYSLRFALLDSRSTPAQQLHTEDDAAVLQRWQAETAAAATDAARVAAENEGKLELTKQRAAVRYANAVSGVHVDYAIHGQTLKESLVFENLPAAASFTFAFYYEGLTAALQEDRSVHFLAEGRTDPVFIVASPYLFDSGDGYTTDVDVALETTPTGCRYTLTPDRAWLADPARQYPVTLDPTTTYTSRDSTLIHDNGVNEDSPGTVFRTYDRIYVGSWKSGTSVYENRMYLRLPLPTQISRDSHYITDATLNLYHYNVSSYQTADHNIFTLHQVNFDWDSTTLKWETQKNIAPGRQFAFAESNKTDTMESFKIGPLVETWYDSGVNRGLMIKPQSKDSAKTNRTCYYSSDSGNTSMRPQAEIIYESYGAASGISSGTSYYLRAKHSSQYVDLNQSNKNVTQFNFLGGKNQEWRVVYDGNGFYKFYTNAPNYSGYCLDIESQSNSNVDIYPDGTGGWLKFRIIPIDDGSYRIKCPWNNFKVLDVYGANNIEGANLYSSYWNGGNNQRFYFEAATQLGGAEPYRDVSYPSNPNAPNINCLGYALKVNYWVGSDQGITFGSDENVYDVYQRVESYVRNTLHRRCRRLASKNDLINPTEYKIALRVGHNLTTHDYHFMVQLNNGYWAHKQSLCNSRMVTTTDPSSIEWKIPTNYDNNYNVIAEKGFYTGDIVYFAVTKP